jgi:acyl-CoA thioester hydrolase
MADHPSYQQLAALPAYAVQAVPVAFEDNNGQLNVRHYLGIGSEGLKEALVGVGIPTSWPTRAGLAALAAQHHVTYFHELRTGDRMSVRVRALGRSEKAAHVLVYVLDDTHERVATAFEEITLCVRLDPRGTEAWPEDIAANLDALVAEHAALYWPAVTSGSLQLR